MDVLEWCGRHPWLTLLFVILVGEIVVQIRLAIVGSERG